MAGEETRSGGGTLLDNLTYNTWMYDADTVDSKIASALTGGLTVKGTKTVAQLNALAPTVGTANAGLKIGDFYNVSDAGTLTAPATSADAAVAAGDNVVWTEDGWDKLHGVVDLSGKQDVITATGILKGTGSGVASAVPGTDYVASLSQASDGVVTVSGTSGALTVDHAKKGPSSSGNTSKGDTTNQTPGFGGTFKVTSATVDKYGHTTALAEHTVTIPSAVAVASGQTGAKNGLMSSGDKAKLDGIASGAQVNAVAGVTVAGTSVVNASTKIAEIPFANTATSGAPGVVYLATGLDDQNSYAVPNANLVSGTISGLSSGVDAVSGAVSGEKAKRNAVATALSTYSGLTQASTMQTTRNLVNALLTALQNFGADAA